MKTPRVHTCSQQRVGTAINHAAHFKALLSTQINEPAVPAAAGSVAATPGSCASAAIMQLHDACHCSVNAILVLVSHDSPMIRTGMPSSVVQTARTAASMRQRCSCEPSALPLLSSCSLLGLNRGTPTRNPSAPSANARASTAAASCGYDSRPRLSVCTPQQAQQQDLWALGRLLLCTCQEECLCMLTQTGTLRSPSRQLMPTCTVP